MRRTTYVIIALVVVVLVCAVVYAFFIGKQSAAMYDVGSPAPQGQSLPAPHAPAGSGEPGNPSTKPNGG